MFRARIQEAREAARSAAPEPNSRKCGHLPMTGPRRARKHYIRARCGHFPFWGEGAKEWHLLTHGRGIDEEPEWGKMPLTSARRYIGSVRKA
jgi:hypothetical protein